MLVKNLALISLVAASLLASFTEPPASATVWKTIKLGTGFKNGQEFLDAMLDKDCAASYYGRKMILSAEFALRISPEEKKLELALVSVSELGFRHEAKLREIYARASERGLSLCPPEVGPQLRLQYLDQPPQEELVVAMEGMEMDTGHTSLFSVLNRGDYNAYPLMVSGANDGSPDALYNDFTRFVFVKSK